MYPAELVDPSKAAVAHRVTSQVRPEFRSTEVTCLGMILMAIAAGMIAQGLKGMFPALSG